MDNFEKLEKFRTWYEDSTGKELKLPNFSVNKDFPTKLSPTQLRDSIVEMLSEENAQPLDDTSYKIDYGNDNYEIVTILPTFQFKVLCKKENNDDLQIYDNVEDFANNYIVTEPWYANSGVFTSDFAKLADECAYTTNSEPELHELSDKEKAENMFNKKKDDAIKRYRNLIACDDDFVITRDNLEDWAVKRTSAEENFDYDSLKEVLCQEK